MVAVDFSLRGLQREQGYDNRQQRPETSRGMFFSMNSCLTGAFECLPVQHRFTVRMRCITCCGHNQRRVFRQTSAGFLIFTLNAYAHLQLAPTFLPALKVSSPPPCEYFSGPAPGPGVPGVEGVDHEALVLFREKGWMPNKTRTSFVEPRSGPN